MALGWRSNYLRYKDFFLNVLLTYRKRPDLKMFLEAILSLATILIFAVFALRPTLITIATLVREIRNKENLVAKTDEKITNLDQASELFSQKEPEITIAKEAVPISAEPDSLLRQIEGVAQKNNVRILGVSFGEIVLSGKEKEKKAKEDVTPLPENARALSFSVSVSSDYQNLLSFLSDLENLRRPSRIDAAGIASSQTAEGTTLTLVISGRTPYIQIATNKNK